MLVAVSASALRQLPMTTYVQNCVERSEVFFSSDDVCIVLTLPSFGIV